MNEGIKVLFLVPNIIGYVRLLILLYSWLKWSHPSAFLALFVLSASLDFLDGTVARRLNQTSEFGAWLDVVIDNISRSMIWTGLFPSFGFYVSSLEWLTFVCTHQLGRRWKTSSQAQPVFVTKVLADNFNTPLGLWVILSVWFLPVWLYALTFYKMPLSLHVMAITATFAVGRLMAFLVEVWFIFQHVLSLLGEE